MNYESVPLWSFWASSVPCLSSSGRSSTSTACLSNFTHEIVQLVRRCINTTTLHFYVFWYNRAMANEFQIRSARLADAEKIFSLIHINRDLLVPRSMGNIVENIDRFLVAVSGLDIVACASFQIHPEIGKPEAATVEIQSVAVRSPYRRKGIGRKIIEAIIARVAAFNPKEVVVLTFAPEFFAALGFREIPKTQIMHKLYTGCINCTKHTDPFTCPEIAMVRGI